MSTAGRERLGEAQTGGDVARRGRASQATVAVEASACEDRKRNEVPGPGWFHR